MYKLLIVPDDLLTLELRESFLDRRGVRTRSALNGEEALAIAMVWTPSLVVFGSTLPDMTAATFVKRLRSSSAAEPPELIRLTSSIEEGVSELADDLYDAHLVAPVEPHQLLNTAAALLSLRQRRWPRARVSLAVSLSGMLDAPGDDEGTPAVTIDLSEGGMRVEPREPLAVGASGTATLVLADGPTQLTLQCTVRALVDEMQLHYGLEFTEATDEQRAALRAFVVRRLNLRESG